MHRPLHFALVDEADSILIDEARIPLVIAGAVEERSLGLPRIAEIARTLRRGEEFDTDEYAHNIFLTERGPSATWTYLVSDEVFGSNLFRGLANRPGIGLWATLLLGPVLFLWGLALHWRRWRDRKRGGGSEPDSATVLPTRRR